MMKVLGTILLSALTSAAVFVGLHMAVLDGTEDSVIDSSVTRPVVNQTIVNQEEAQMEAIEQVTEAIVGIVTFNQHSIGGQGSGIVYAVSDGNTYIVTNEHVVAGGDYFEVVFNDEDQTRVEAVLVGADAYTDVAVMRVDDFVADTVATFGNTEDLRIGQTVIAIGNPLGLEFAGSATMGVVSGHDRTVTIPIISNNRRQDWAMTVLQTDTAINPGNSGGALINLNGEVVGINSMKIAESAVEGMSFSIPTYIALPIISDLEAYGEVIRPTLGVALYNMSWIPDITREHMGIGADVRSGVFVSEVMNDSLASYMGVQAGDVVMKIGDVTVQDMMEFRRELFNYREGDELILEVLRDGERLELSATVVISN